MDKKAKINIKDNNHTIPLHYTVLSGRQQIVTFLFGKSAKINTINNFLYTLLTKTIEYKNEKIVNNLIKKNTFIIYNYILKVSKLY